MSTCFPAREICLFQQSMDDAGFLDGKKQDLKIAQSAKDDSATGPLQHHQFEIPVDWKDDVEMYLMPASPHDRDVMPKTRGVMLRDPVIHPKSVIFKIVTCSEIWSKVLI